MKTIGRVMAGVLVGVWLPGADVSAETVTLKPIQDNTLYESPAGTLSNGVGELLFAGRTGQPLNFRRRALIAFDIAGSLPVGSTVHSVTLVLKALQSASTSTTIALHRLTNHWGEGTSDSGIHGGSGAPATTGDATWIHTVFNTSFWSTPGGDFIPTPSAGATAASMGPVTWTGSQDLMDDVQQWLDVPSANFGWILIGDETTPRTAVLLGSRENGTPENRPRLVVEFTRVSSVPTVSQWGLVILSLSLWATAKMVFGRRASSGRLS